MAEQNAPEQKQEFAIVAKVKQMLKLDDAGRIELFVRREIKSCTTAIKQLKHNKSKLELDWENEFDTITQKLEDCHNKVEDAYVEIDPDKVKINSDRELFSDVYWGHILDAEARLKNIKEVLKTAKADYSERKADIDEQISRYELRISRLSKTA